jgi:hypothetical protein
MSFRPVDMLIALNAKIKELIVRPILCADDMRGPCHHAPCKVDSVVKSYEQLCVWVFVQR